MTEDFTLRDAWGGEGLPETEPITVIDPSEEFSKFLKRYYKDQIGDLKHNRSKSLVVSYEDILNWKPDRSDQLLDDPDEIMSFIKGALIDTLIDGKDVDDKERESYRRIPVRITSLPRSTPIRYIEPAHLNKLVQIEGMVKSITEIKARITRSAWRCPTCGAITLFTQEVGPMERPDGCSSCNVRKLRLIPDLCVLQKAQRISFQERPEGLRGGEMPQTIDIEIADDICGKLTAGNPAKIVGILRGYQQANAQHPFIEYIMEGVSLEMDQREYDEIHLSDEDVEEIISLSKNPDIYSLMANSISPDIKGNEFIKSAIIYQLFGGVRKTKQDGGRIRGEIHILLITDPSCGKSQMMRYITQIIPRAIMTSGGGTSKVGLTAACIKSELDGRYTLEAGAMVLADNGVLLCDEFDKMNSDDRSAMHEALEQGSITVAKGGINATLQARCSVLASANPKQGRFDNFSGLAEQINMIPSLLSRFDLIYTMTDQAEAIRDKEIADHIATVHEIYGRMGAGIEVDDSYVITIMPQISPDLLRKYISYAKHLPAPYLSPDAKLYIVSYYTKLRGMAASANKPVPVTARQMEGMIRLAEASAKIRLSPIVDIDDAKRAITMVDDCLKGIAYDPATGCIDYDKMAGKTSTSKRAKNNKFTTILEELTEERGFCYEKEIYEVAEERGFTKKEIETTLEEMHRSASITINKNKIKLL